MDVSNGSIANNSPRRMAAMPGHPVSAKEVAEEMRRLRELARLMQTHSTRAERYAIQWLKPPGESIPAIERWSWGARNRKGLICGDLEEITDLLRDMVSPASRFFVPEPWPKPATLEYYANILEPQLMEWLHELQATPEAQQAKNEATIELVRVLANKELPGYATKVVRANPIAAMLLAGNAMEATELNPGEWSGHVAIRREAEWTRHKNLLLEVVDDAAVVVVASGSDPAPLFSITEMAARGNIVAFSQQWPSVAVILRTAEARRKADALAKSAKTTGRSRGSADRIGEVGEAERTNQGERDAFESDALAAPADGITEPDVLEAPSTTPQAIPVDKRTKPMSKKEAMNFIGRPAHAENDRQAVNWLSQLIRDGEYRYEPINRKKGVYHIDDFPAECHKEIRKV